MAPNDEGHEDRDELDGVNAGELENDRTSSQEESGGADGSAGTGDGDTDGDDDPRVRRANRDAARYRRELREEQAARKGLEERLARLEKSGGSDGEDELERTKRELEEERTGRTAAAERLRRVSVRAEIAAQAGALKLADVDAALALMRDRDPSLSGLEWDNDEPTAESVREALEDLLEAKPFLRVVEATTEPGTARSGSGGSAGGEGRGGKAPRETDEERRARLRGERTSSVWDPELARQRGGGVVA